MIDWDRGFETFGALLLTILFVSIATCVLAVAVFLVGAFIRKLFRISESEGTSKVQRGSLSFAAEQEFETTLKPGEQWNSFDPNEKEE